MVQCRSGGKKQNETYTANFSKNTSKRHFLATTGYTTITQQPQHWSNSSHLLAHGCLANHQSGRTRKNHTLKAIYMHPSGETLCPY